MDNDILKQAGTWTGNALEDCLYDFLRSRGETQFSSEYQEKDPADRIFAAAVIVESAKYEYHYQTCQHVYRHICRGSL